MTQRNDAWRAVAKAWDEDPAYRARMEADPKAALAAEGVHIDADEVRVVVDTDEVVHLALPPDPNSDLVDEGIENVSGGLFSSHATPPPRPWYHRA